MNKIREGYKVTELGEIPNEWSIMKLSEIAEINPRREVLEDKDTVSFIAMEDITNNGRVINKTDKLYEEVKKGYTPFKDNDVLLAKITPCFENGKRALVGKLSNGIGFGSTEFHVLRANKESISKFLYYVISSHRFMSKAENNMTGSAGQKRVPTEFIKDYVLAVPTIKEQEKIASILSTIDEQIDNVDALIEKNKELKKGLMQTLLTKGIGHTKFKKTEIGEIPEEWEVKKIIDIATTTSGGTPSRAKKEYYENGIYPWVKTGELYNKYISETEEYITEDALKKSSAKLVQEGAVIIAMYGATIGKLSIAKRSVTTNQACCSIICNDNICYNEYLYYRLDFEKENIINLGAGGAQPNISQDIIKSYKLAIPSIVEQQRIALILSEIDEKIDEYENKKKKLEELKKGSHRDYSTGFFLNRPDENSNNYKSASYIRNYDFIGLVRGYDSESGLYIVEQRNKMSIGDKIEVIGPYKETMFTTIEEMYDEEGNPIESAPHARQIVKMKVGLELKENYILRKPIEKTRIL